MILADFDCVWAILGRKNVSWAKKHKFFPARLLRQGAGFFPFFFGSPVEGGSPGEPKKKTRRRHGPRRLLLPYNAVNVNGEALSGQSM